MKAIYKGNEYLFTEISDNLFVNKELRLAIDKNKMISYTYPWYVDYMVEQDIYKVIHVNGVFLINEN